MIRTACSSSVTQHFEANIKFLLNHIRLTGASVSISGFSTYALSNSDAALVEAFAFASACVNSRIAYKKKRPKSGLCSDPGVSPA